MPTDREWANIHATCDRIAQRMGGRFVEREDNPMTDTPEAVAWLYTSESGDKALLLDCNSEYARCYIEQGLTETPLYTHPADDNCPSCNGLNTSCPDGCGRDFETGELNGTVYTGNPYIDLDVGSITVPIGYVRKMVDALKPYAALPVKNERVRNATEALELSQSVITAFDQEAERG